MGNGILAKLVWDGTNEVRIPAEMGTPRADQMLGTAAERLGEISGRVCYDSLGKGRPSFSDRIITGADPHTGEQLFADVQGYHDHILQVNHSSVYEHYHATLALDYDNSADSVDRAMKLVWLCVNRPGVLVLPAVNLAGARSLRITVNPRSVLEWPNWTKKFYGKADPDGVETMLLWKLLLEFGGTLAPAIFCMMPPITAIDVWPEIRHARIVEPVSEHEKWISLFMSGSRGLSHEQVRHGDFTAISQRSTRFVDEDGSLWVEHPLITAYMAEKTEERDSVEYAEQFEVLNRTKICISEAQETYRLLASKLQPWLESRGIDKTSARKQARGAARGFLGNALQTEMIFSASVAQWKIMLGQRASQFADAEIRECYANEKDCVLSALKSSRYADSFAGLELAPSPDGIGHVVTGL